MHREPVRSCSLAGQRLILAGYRLRLAPRFWYSGASHEYLAGEAIQVLNERGENATEEPIHGGAVAAAAERLAQ